MSAFLRLACLIAAILYLLLVKVAAAQQSELPGMLDFMPEVLEMAGDPPPEFNLNILCQAHLVPEGQEQGYLSALTIDHKRAFIIASSPHELERPWKTITLRGEFVEAGQSHPIKGGTMDWAYIFDRNHDGKVDFFAYLVGPLWILPYGMDDRRLPKVGENVTTDVFDAHRDKLRMAYWYAADENFDGHHDGLIARLVDKRTGWATGWIVARDTDFDRRYDSCVSMRGSLNSQPKSCRRTKDGYQVRGHTIAGLARIPVPQVGFPLSPYNTLLENCELGASRLYSHPLPAWADFVPETVDFEAQPEEVTRSDCNTDWRYDSCNFLALNDDTTAQVTLGRMFTLGRGVAEDKSQALYWFQKAAELGNADGQFRLGLQYFAGDGVTQDYSLAVELFRRAAEQNHADAQYWLGRAYLDGDGVVKDEEQAVSWLLRSAEQENANAQLMIGICSQEGLGVPQDDASAVDWFRKAAEQGNSRAQYKLASCYWAGEGVTEDRAEALTWFRKSADQGYGPAEIHLAMSYFGGDGVAQSNAEGVKWLQRAAEGGDSTAQLLLGLMYLSGKRVPENVVLGFVWISIAAHSGHQKAVELRDAVRPLMTREQREAADQLVQRMLRN